MEIRIEQTSDGKKIQDALSTLHNSSVKIGWFENNRYPDAESTPVASVAYLQENGGITYFSRNRKHKAGPDKPSYVPPRPFIRPAIISGEKVVLKELVDGSEKLLRNETTLDIIFGRIGVFMQGEIQKKITEVHAPILSEMTLALRKWKREKGLITSGYTEKPLEDSMLMFNSVNYKVGDE